MSGKPAVSGRNSNKGEGRVVDKRVLDWARLIFYSVAIGFMWGIGGAINETARALTKIAAGQ